jgi:hypothetical protein
MAAHAPKVALARAYEYSLHAHTTAAAEAGNGFVQQDKNAAADTGSARQSVSPTQGIDGGETA